MKVLPRSWTAVLLITYYAGAFQFASTIRQPLLLSTKVSKVLSAGKTTTPLMVTPSVILPGPETVIGTVGRGYICILIAKLAAHRSHGKSWIICPSSEIDVMRQLAAVDSYGTQPENLELVPASDTDRIEALLGETQALMLGVDDVDSVVDSAIVEYLLDPAKVGKIRRVVAMSRNLNGSGMGVFVSASKRAANAQVWDNSQKDAYEKFEENVKNAAKSCGANWTIFRAGTLKGGACGENNVYSQYLSESFYEMTKSDIVTWQLLFDCNVRGVKLMKGDVLPGPGMKAVFTATGTEEHEGDTSRSGIAEAMVRSLEFEGLENIDFGVSTIASRDPPSDDEWKALFSSCLSIT